VCWTEEHRTVRCPSPDGLVHDPANLLLLGILVCVGYNSPDHPRVASDSPVCQQPTTSATLVGGQRSTGAPDCPVPPTRRSGAHQNRKATNHAIHSRCTVHCPVHPRTDGNQGLPNGAPTAPRFLGAIKGTPRCMELHTKHSLNILQR
jgi:hypothetical protein